MNDSVVFTQGAFEKAMEVCGAELMDRITYYKESWWPARKLVEEAIADRFEVCCERCVMSEVARQPTTSLKNRFVSLAFQKTSQS